MQNFGASNNLALTVIIVFKGLTTPCLTIHFDQNSNMTVTDFTVSPCILIH